MAAHVGTGFTFTGGGGPELVIGQMVSPDFFTVLGAQPLLGRVSPLDAPTLAGVSLVLAVVAVLASYIPARRALRIQPITALSPE